MRICLITPPSQFLLDERVFCSLGILKIGAVLENAGHQVDHLDLSGVNNYEDVVNAYEGATTFAITATTPQMPTAIKIAHAIRQRGMKTIIGGPHATLVVSARKINSPRAEDSWKALTENFDVIVAGDGERAVFTALTMQRGLVDADDQKSALWMTSKDFDESPWPARHLLDMDSYKYAIEGKKSLSLIGQLGCPYGCFFCAGRDSAMLRRIRLRTTQNVIDELMSLHRTYGVEGVMMLDDELNVNKQMLDLMRGIAATGVDWRLRGFIKSELFTDDQAEAMYAAGFRQILVGFESGSPRILENIQKRATVEDNTRAIQIAHRHGLKVKALMSIGHPGESRETIQATKNWLIEVNPSDFDVTVITPYPGSPYYDRSVWSDTDDAWVFAAKNGDELLMHNVDFSVEADYYKGAAGSYVSHVWTRHISAADIVLLRDEVENDVRKALNIPFYPTGSAINFEHSMGMTAIPSHILRSSQ